MTHDGEATESTHSQEQHGQAAWLRNGLHVNREHMRVQEVDFGEIQKWCDSV